MTPAIFTAACQVLWGSAYQSPGARELGISRSSMVRYATGEYRVPPEIFGRLGDMLEERRNLIQSIAPEVVRAGQRG